MAVRVETQDICDPCLREQGIEREATFHDRVAIGVTAPQVIGLCFDHEAELVEPLRAALGKYGVRPQTPVEQFISGDHCPVCQAPFKNQKALLRHVERDHSAILAAIDR